jgi:transcription initiation factor TFIIIB Brf1 subunit/transcription initiation factor TFIIB
MAAQEGETCPRCGDDQLRLDEQDGFILCPSCGFVAEEGMFGGPLEVEAGEPGAAPVTQQGEGEIPALGG